MVYPRYYKYYYPGPEEGGEDMNNYKVSKNEWLNVFEIFGWYVLGIAVNWVLANLNLLPISPATAGILGAILKLVKYMLDGKVT